MYPSGRELRFAVSQDYTGKNERRKTIIDTITRFEAFIERIQLDIDELLQRAELLKKGGNDV